MTPSSLSPTGDGTPVVTSHRERKHHICDCASKGFIHYKCDRYFSQPDCDIGWDFTIGKDGVPICREGRRMNHDSSAPSKYRIKFRCPLASRTHGCSCEHACSDSKYGRIVHLAMKDNPRPSNLPPRDSDEWKLEYNARTSTERSNKREKLDFKLEDGRHHSTKMWYCRLYHILMLQHLDAWDIPFEYTLRKLILQTA